MEQSLHYRAVFAADKVWLREGFPVVCSGAGFENRNWMPTRKLWPYWVKLHQYFINNPGRVADFID